MALSFTLAKKGGIWWATADLGAKQPIRVQCGDGSEKAARVLAEQQLKRRKQLIDAGRQRWTNLAKAKAAAAAAPAVNDFTPPPAPAREEPAPAPLSSGDNAPPPPPPPAPPPAAPERAAEIAAKLRALGDGRPIEPDEIHPPGADPRDDVDPEDPPLDNEAGELIAEIFADAVLVGHIKAVSARLKKRKPPMKPGEPNERMQQWYRDGVAYNTAKLVGKATTMGPTGKMFVGAILMTAGMLIDAEPIDVVPPATAAPSPPAAAQTPAPAAAADVETDHQPAPVQTTALGRFR